MNDVTLGLDAPAIVVRMPDPDSARLVRTLFPAYLQEVGPASTTVEVERRSDGYVVAEAANRSGARRSEVGSPQAMFSVVEYCITRALLKQREEYVHLHAAGAVVRGRAIVWFGPAGAGKSSLAMAFHRAGYPLLGDDLVFVDELGRASAFARPLKLHQDRARDFGVDPESTPARDPDDPEVWCPLPPAAWHRGSVPVAFIARVQYRAGPTEPPASIESAELLNELLHGTVRTGREGAAAFPTLTALVASTDGIRFGFGAVEAAVTQLVGRLSDDTTTRP